MFIRLGLGMIQRSILPYYLRAELELPGIEEILFGTFPYPISAAFSALLCFLKNSLLFRSSFLGSFGRLAVRAVDIFLTCGRVLGSKFLAGQGMQ